MSPPRYKLLGPAFALLGAIGFSAKAILIKIAYATANIDSVTLLALRMLFSLPFFLAMAWYAGRQPAAEPLQRRDWLLLTWFGFLGYYFSSYLDFKGLQYISAALERLILFTYPAVVVFLSALLYKRAIHGREIFALLLSFSGIALVFLQDLRISESPHSLWIGGGLVFAASLTYAGYLVGNTGTIRRLGAARFTGLAAAISSVFVLSHFFATHPLAALNIPSSLYLTVTALALISTALPIWFTSEALRLIGPSRVAIISSVGPIVTIALGAIFLGEHLTVITVGGALLVLGGVSLVTR